MAGALAGPTASGARREIAMFKFRLIRSRSVLALFTFLAAFAAPAGAATIPSTPFTGTAFAIPGSFEAEDFDRGGEGVAYHDNVPGNAGGQYRPNEDVDIIVSSDSAGGGFVVNNFETGEWLEYSINVQTATNYDIELRVASAFTNSAFHVEIDDVDVTGRISVPNTGSWSAFQWVGKKGVALMPGQHVLKVVTDQQYFDFNSVRVLQTLPSTPFTGTPIAIPGSFEAENFDLGGESAAYHDNVPGNAGGQYRPNEDVDIIVSSDSASGGFVVNNFETGEWLNYTVNVQNATNYDIELRVSSQFSTSAFHVEIDGQNVTGSIVVPNTGNWNTFQWVGKKGIALTAGQHVLKVFADQQYFNLNSVRVLQSTTRYEETDPSVSFSSGWIRDNGWFAWSGGNAMESMTPGAQATFSFTGTAVTWLGMRGPDSGIARVFVDGAFVSQVDMFARSYEIHVPVFAAKGLANGGHTLTIEVTGLKNTDSQAAMSPYALVVVDAFDVPAHVVSHIQDTDPDWSYTGNWTFDDTTRSWSGWMASISSGPGAQATLPFNGTSVSWIGYRGPDAGIARVFLDGVFAGEVDLYYSDPRVQAIVFTSAQLADGNHTIAIVATGTKNSASSGTLVVVDAIDVNRPGTRFEETEPAVSFSGSWVQGNINRAWSLGTVAETGVAGATATFTFTGTDVSWIGCRKLSTGIADVYLDGVFQTEIDTFQAPPIEAYQHTIFKATGLANGSHTLTIVVTGRTNPAAFNNLIVIDAFDVRP
jgi:uncharacterized protein involved in high-affinity Fe2+ transport